MTDEANPKNSGLLCYRGEENRARSKSFGIGDKYTCHAIRFWPLKKGIPSDQELTRLADNIQQDWKRLGAALGLKEKYLIAIEINYPNDVYERALAVLQKWKKKMGRKATYDRLAEALHDQLVQRPGLVMAFSTDMEDNNVWKLKTGTPTDEELQDLAQEIPQDWKRLGRAVGLKEKHLKIIEIDNVGDVFERALATLYKWKEKQGQEATYGKLAAALNDDLVQRRDLVDRFCCDICPTSAEVSSSQDNLDLLTDQVPKEEKEEEEHDGHRQITKKLEEEPNKTETKKQLSSDIKQESCPSYQEALHIWKKWESVKGKKERTPSWKIRQLKANSDSEEERKLQEEIEHLKGTMESAMERMDAVLHRVQNSSIKRRKNAAALVKQKAVTDESDPCEEGEKLSDGVNAETAMDNENKEIPEYKSDSEERKEELKTDARKLSVGCDETSDSLLLELPTNVRLSP